MHRPVLLALAGAVLAPAVLMAAAGAEAAAAGLPAGTTASVVPATAVPGGTATFSVSCARLDTAAATLLGQPLGLPTLIPMDAAASQGDFVITVRLPGTTRPRGYHLSVDCSDGTSATVALRVESARAAAAAAASRAAAAAGPAPVSTALAIGGLALMAVGAVAGCFALARLRSAYRSRAG